MRYYDITVGSYNWVCMNDPGALAVEMDVSLTANDTPTSGYVRIYNPGLDVLSNIQNMFDKDVIVKGGMSGGLPLENASQAGLLFRGKTFQAFGNWEGTDQRLDVIITAGGSSKEPGPNPKTKPKNLVLDWKKGQPLGDALQQTLQQAYPEFSVDNRLSSSLTPKQNQLHVAGSIEQLAHFVRRWSQQLVGDDTAQGASIHLFDGVFNLFDGSQQQQAGSIQPTDLIGQPQWIKANTISIKTVMRSDIHVGETVTLPKTLVGNSQTGANSLPGSSQTGLVASGSFQVSQTRHVGNSRQPDGASWCSIFEAFTATGTSS